MEKGGEAKLPTNHICLPPLPRTSPDGNKQAIYTRTM